MSIARLLVVVPALMMTPVVPSRATAGAQHPGDARTSQAEVTRSLVSVYRRASRQANTYCASHKDASFPVTRHADIQRIFNIDQAIRVYGVAPEKFRSGSDWSSPEVNAFWRTEAGYLQRLLDDSRAFERIVGSESLNTATFELLTISMHVSRHAPKIGKAVASRFRAVADGRGYMVAMAAQLDSDIQHRADILKASVPLAALPDTADRKNCFSAAHEYYKAAMVSQDKRLAARVLEELRSVAKVYGDKRINYVSSP